MFADLPLMRKLNNSSRTFRVQAQLQLLQKVQRHKVREVQVLQTVQQHNVTCSLQLTSTDPTTAQSAASALQTVEHSFLRF